MPSPHGSYPTRAYDSYAYHSKLREYAGRLPRRVTEWQRGGSNWSRNAQVFALYVPKFSVMSSLETTREGGGHRSARILYAEDDPAMRTLFEMNLEAEGFDVHLVADGDAAYHAAHELMPDLIVLDIMMPGRDGYTVLRELKDDPRTQHIPVVLLTAKATDEDVWEGWQSGADYYITKPFNVEEFVHFFDYLFSGAEA